MSQNGHTAPVNRDHNSETGWPDKSEVKSYCELVRPGPRFGWTVTGIILSDEPYKVRTHYLAKTVKCTATHGRCAACEAGRPTRWAGYVAFLRNAGKGFAIVELTPGVTPTLERWLHDHGTLRGTVITLERMKGRQNVIVRVANIAPYSGPMHDAIPAAFDVRAAMHRIWGLKLPPKSIDLSTLTAEDLRAMHTLKAAEERHPDPTVLEALRAETEAITRRFATET